MSSAVKVFDEELKGQEFELFVFGSQANKEKLIASDIDLGIKSEKPIDEIILGRIKRYLNEELASLYTFDVIDFTKTDAKFNKVALENIEILKNDHSKS